MRKILFSFPGQGSQYPRMLDGIANRNFYEDLCLQTLNKSLGELTTEEALQHNANVQASLLICGVSWANDFIQKGIKPSFTAGLSIGAFPAAVIAGALPMQTALKIVYRRGTLMQEAYPTGYGLTAVVGLTLGKVEQICTDTGCFIANYNAEDQIVVAGSNENMSNASAAALKAGAVKCVRIKITVPSHCELLNSAANALAEEFSNVELSRPRITYISGSTGRAIFDPEKLKEDLLFNMCRRTQWHEAMVSVFQRDCNVAIEMPPGETLTGLTKKAFLESLCISVQTMKVEEIFDQLEFMQ